MKTRNYPSAETAFVLENLIFNWLYIFFLCWTWQIGSSNNSNSKPSDPVPTQHNSQRKIHHDTTLPLLGLSSSTEHVKSDNQETDNPQLASSHKQKVPVWLYGLLDSQLKASNYAAKPSSPIAAPNLELTLAAPRPSEQNKRSPAPLIFGPVSVTWTHSWIIHGNYATPSRRQEDQVTCIIHCINY